MASRLLDYERPSRKSRPHDASVVPATPVEAGPPVVAAPVQQTVSSPADAPKGPLDYPSISSWLKTCEDDFERGRDRHEYSKLAFVFSDNGCTRIDDITRMSPDLIKKLASEVGVDVSLGLVFRVFEYAAADVVRVRKAGKLY